VGLKVIRLEGVLYLVEYSVYLGELWGEFLLPCLPLDHYGLDLVVILRVADSQGETVRLAPGGNSAIYAGTLEASGHFLDHALHPRHHLVHPLLVLHYEAYDQVKDVGLGPQGWFIRHAIQGSIT